MARRYLSDQERNAVLVLIGSNAIPEKGLEIIEELVAKYAAEALREAANAVKKVRESDDLPPGVTSHPIAEHFEKWLRVRADGLVAEEEP